MRFGQAAAFRDVAVWARGQDAKQKMEVLHTEVWWEVDTFSLHNASLEHVSNPRGACFPSTHRHVEMLVDTEHWNNITLAQFVLLRVMQRLFLLCFHCLCMPEKEVWPLYLPLTLMKVWHLHQSVAVTSCVSLEKGWQWDRSHCESQRRKWHLRTLVPVIDAWPCCLSDPWKVGVAYVPISPGEGSVGPFSH